MTWREMQLSLQLAAEERAGFVLRQQQRQALAVEDQAVAGLRRAAE